MCFYFKTQDFQKVFIRSLFKNYRMVIYGKTEPSKEAVDDQINRGKNLFNRQNFSSQEIYWMLDHQLEL